MSQERDWTTGPAKWAAALALGGASVFGIGWSVMMRGAPVAVARVVLPEEAADRPRAGQSEEAGPEEAGPEQAGPEQAGPGAERPSPEAAVRRVNINTAGAGELELLPGIGPALAARIVEYRRAKGPFTSVEQLDQVKGIGPRILERLRPLVKLE